MPWPTSSKTACRGATSGSRRRFGDTVDVTPERQFLGFDAYKKAIDCLRPGRRGAADHLAAFRPLHFEYAVQKGVNVFMEKSFAVDAAGRAADAQGGRPNRSGRTSRSAAGFMWRHSQGREEVIERIHDGAIGDVHTLRIYRVHGPGGHCEPLPKGPTS